MSYTNTSFGVSETTEQLMEYIANNLLHFTYGEYAGYIPPSLAELYVLRGYVEAAIVEATNETQSTN